MRSKAAMIRVWIIILILIKCSGCAQIWESAEKVSEEIHGGRDLSTLIIQNLRSQEKYKCEYNYAWQGTFA